MAPPVTRMAPPVTSHDLTRDPIRVTREVARDPTRDPTQKPFLKPSRLRTGTHSPRPASRAAEAHLASGYSCASGAEPERSASANPFLVTVPSQTPITRS